MSHGLGPTRAKVLELLQSAGDPLSISDVADQLGLHRNSARFHLTALEEKGFVERTTASTGMQGRPPLHYTATQDSPTIGAMHLLEMTEILLDQFVVPKPDAFELAWNSGRRWGQSLARQERPTEPGAILPTLTNHLRERGFAARVQQDSMVFTRCPFRNAVSDDLLPLVCRIHQGLMDGYLEASGSQFISADLSIGERACVVGLADRTTASS